MRARHQSNRVPAARVYGSPGISHPPMHPSNSPNGLYFDAAPRRGDAEVGVSIAESRLLYHSGPASSMTTFAPACVRTYAAMPPPAPEPTMHTSYSSRAGDPVDPRAGSGAAPPVPGGGVPCGTPGTGDGV